MTGHPAAGPGEPRSERAAANGSTKPGDAQPSAQTMRWSEPFERLAVGQRFRTGERVIRDTDVIVFCALTGDWHPQHCDAEWAARSPFGERIAHGMLTLSLAVGLVPLDPELVLALRRVGDVVFKRPVRLDERIHVEGELAALKAIDRDTGLVEFAWAVRDSGGLLVCRASVQVLWRRASAAEHDRPPRSPGEARPATIRPEPEALPG